MINSIEKAQTVLDYNSCTELYILRNSYNAMQNNDAYYRTFYYLLVGAQGVGKTNIITRFIKDQFIEAHNLIIEGQQTAIFIIDNCEFKIVFRDNRNVTELQSISIDNYKSIHGVVFVFSLEKQQTLLAIQKQIQYYLTQVNPLLIRNQQTLPFILVGNKADLLNTSLNAFEVISSQTEKDIRKGQYSPSISDRIRCLENMGVKYFQISAKCSTKKEIEAIFLEMINQNQINRFVVQPTERPGWIHQYLSTMPCTSEDCHCQIY